MADKEHPAAKAGRFVRAAGIALGKEIDRRAEAAAARPAPAAPPPPPPPPPVPTESLLGRIAFFTFVGCLVILGLTLLHLDELVPGEAQKILRLVLASVLFAGAVMLLTNWHEMRERIGQRLLNHLWGRRSAVNRREKTFARILREVLTLVGIAFLAAAVYQLLVAIFGI
jgi:hypothetical protein